MNSEEEYINQIELLKQALQFYANKENYLFFKDKDAPIALDEGSQAKFALEKIALFQDDRDEQEKEFVKNMISAIEADVNPEIIMGLISTYKTQTENQ